MPRNGAGTFVLTYDWVQDAANGIKIRADRHKAQDQEFADALTASIAKDGQTSPTANLPMATFKHTNVGAATNATDYLRADQVQKGDLVTFTATGTDTYAITPSPAVTAYATGQTWQVIFTNANTGAATLNVSGLGAKSITKNGTTALVSGDIVAGSVHRLTYDGTRFQLDVINPLLRQGSWEIWIPAAAMWPASTNGAESNKVVEVAATQPVIFAMAFDPSTKEYAQFSIRWPKSLGTATFTFTPVWTHPATTTNFGVVFSCAASALSDDDALGQAFGTSQTSTDTGGTTSDVYVGPTSSAITAGNTPSANDLYYFQIAREVADGADTMAVDAYLMGVVLTVTVGAANDA